MTTTTLAPVVPVTLGPPLWWHQLAAYTFAKDLPAAMLCMDMGTGKTKTMLTLMANRGFRRVLILCPQAVVQVWADQFPLHCPEPYQVLALDSGSIGSRADTLEQAYRLAADRQLRLAVVINYEAAFREPMRGLLLTWDAWDCAVLDESHRIKKPGGKWSMFCSHLGLRVPARFCLTGTPLPHSQLDVYAQYRFLDRSIFGTSYRAFVAHYAELGGWNGKIPVKPKNQEELQRKMATIAFRVKSEDVLDLPKYVDIVRVCDFNPKTKRLYRTLEQEFVADVGAGLVTADNALTRLLRLQQLTSGYAKTDRSTETGEDGQLVQVDKAKADLLTDVLEDLAPAEPVVIFARFTHDLDLIHAAAAALRRQSRERSGRKKELLSWQQGEAPILAVQIRAGNVGLDMTRARYVIFFSLGFSLTEYLQARKRIHRPGQQHPCTYIHLVVRGSVDQEVYRALERREKVVEAILAWAQSTQPPPAV